MTFFKNNLKIAGLAGAGAIAISGIAGIYQQADACGVGVSEFKVKANLNVRAGAGTEYEVVGTLKKGDVVKPFASHKNGLWGEVKLSNGRTGCVSMQYLEEIDNCDDSNTDTETVPSNEEWTGYTTANLNVRLNPTTSSSIATTLPKGTQIKVEYQTSKGWARIRYQYKHSLEYGYVSSQYISKSNVSNDVKNDATVTISGKSGVTTANLNLRKDSSTSSQVIFTLQKGTTVDILSKSGNWYYVECGNPNSGKPARGYVSAQYISVR